MASPSYSPAGGYGTQEGDYFFTQTPSGGQWTSTPASNVVTGNGSVLGDSTVNTGQTQQEQQQQTGGDGGGLPALDFNAIFDPIMAQLGQTESMVRGQQPGIEEEIQTQYGTSKGSLEGERDIGQRGIAESERGTTQRKTDASSAARRLHSEQQRGGRQRWGGSSSAGQAFSEISNVEHQRQQGGIQRLFTEGMQKIEGFKADLQTRFTTALAELENQKNSALNESKRWFQERLNEISGMKNQAESDKAMARYESLQNLRNTVQAINMQDYQYQQQLQANRQGSEQQVEQARQRLMQMVQGGQQTQQDFQSQTTVRPEGIRASLPGTATQQQPTGQTTTGKKWNPETGTWE